MTRFLRSALFVAVATAALLMAGCSGTKEEPTFDPDGADEIALQMLPEARVLPGTGWLLISENDFSDDEDDEDEFPEDQDRCSRVNETISDLEVFDRDERVGRAEREFEVGMPGDEPIEVEITAEIYSSVAKLSAAARSYDSIVTSGDFGHCLVAYMEAFTDEATTIDATEQEPSAKSPRGGWQIAIVVTVRDADGETNTHFESYVWQIGNAMVSVTFSGAKERMTDQFVSQVLDRVDGSAMVAATGS
ncbi:MAG: hypothetical protein ACRDHF_00720 [Tepidiformaceae bacterium]